MAEKRTGWVAVDFDRTLATLDEWQGPEYVGAPIEPMVKRVKIWLSEGREVRIFTARLTPFAVCVVTDQDILKLPIKTERHADAVKSIYAIRGWCKRVFGRELPITNVKDMRCLRIYDDIAVRVQPNTGLLLK